MIVPGIGRLLLSRSRGTLHYTEVVPKASHISMNLNSRTTHFTIPNDMAEQNFDRGRPILRRTACGGLYDLRRPEFVSVPCLQQRRALVEGGIVGQHSIGPGNYRPP